MKLKYSQIANIMDNFDFENVHNSMELLKWMWLDKVPDISEIKDTAFNLLNECWNGCEKEIEHSNCNPPRYFCATGGFESTATYYTGDSDFEEGIYLELRFVLDGWDNY